jgi:hypothetical protein
MTHCAPIALASGSSRVVPWFILANKLDLCIGEEYIPANVRPKFCDPSRMTLEVLDTLLSLWYQRQEDPDIATTFQFKRYPDKEGETHAANPRKLLPTKTQPTDPAPSRSVPPKRESRKKEKNRKGKKRVRVRARKNSESEGEEFPGLLEGDSATSDAGELGVSRKETEIPKLNRKIKPRPISKKKHMGSDDEETGNKLEGLDPELQTIHDNTVAKAGTQKKKKVFEGTGVGKELEVVGPDKNLPKKPYRFGPVSHGGAGRDFVGVITHPLGRHSLKHTNNSLTTGSSRKRRHVDVGNSPLQKRDDVTIGSLQKRHHVEIGNSPPHKRLRDEDDNALPTSPSKKVKKNPAHATQREEKSPLKKKALQVNSDRQTRASSHAKRIQTRSKGRMK